MARSIVTAASIAAATRTREAPGGSSRPTPVADEYSDALLKLIPVEVIGVYLSIHAIAGASADNGIITQIAIFVIGALLTFFYLKVYLNVSNTLQVVISVGAFCVWALAINSSGPHALVPGTWSGIIVLVYTFVAPKIPIDSKPSDENMN